MTDFMTTMTYWKCEDTGLVKARDNQVWTEKKPTQSTRMNALWKEGRGLSPSLPDAQYFEITILEAPEGKANPVSIGLTDEAHFASGWNFKGMSFAGNLSDGSGLLAQNFGPGVKQGDVVGLRMELVLRKNKRYDLEVYYSVNGEGLGKAFSIQEVDIVNIGALYPAVGFSTGPAKVVIERKSAPEAQTLERSGAEGTRESVQGGWSTSASSLVGEDSDELPPIIVKVNLEGDNATVQARVANSITTGVSAEKPHKSSGQAMSTKMMPPPKVMALEEAVTSMLTSIEDLELVDGTLKISHSNGESIQLQPYDDLHEPIVMEQIHWMQRTDQ
mmetsp:Transcript_18829/g.36935  ORF Transcript_18829/g.36935 Transcript_18829/m.36935 type:complete len:331 (+) Transcript_18829:141-1133(+)|eukprot:CAMPEP_0171501356 /NCGR_PEP_ID=MMETSP0958-20121227/9512_1 /TAXON_ID=87120 /ORGANISM="Aurantiochytrium limacinum, Strain ATCCMYA-1381" /LENGTH=330 /DNA_ID=CAMNT_0012036161 /DNA_START=143 /DNA_END=1135 /DNA_ORIENTATION=+